jgi:hypothetical protein
VTKYRTRPLHFFGLPGLLLSGFGVGLLVYLSVLWFLGHSIGTRPLLTLGVLLTLAGLQFVCFGLLGELLVRTTVAPREIYSIREQSRVAAPSSPSQKVPTIEDRPELASLRLDPDIILADDGPPTDPSAETRLDIPIIPPDELDAPR